MLGWLRGAQPTEDGDYEDLNKENTETPGASPFHDDGAAQYSPGDAVTPETPAAVYALKAIRTTIFGTPHPTKDPLPPAKKKRVASKSSRPASKIFAEYENGAAQSKSSGDLTDSKDIIPSLHLGENSTVSTATTATSVSKEFNKGAIYIHPDNEPSQQPSEKRGVGTTTPIKQRVPQGILCTPGVQTAKKKAVSFAATTIDGDKPRPQPRARSGLPHEFPGKFPSPWTPRTGATPKFKVSKPTFDIKGKENKAKDSTIKSKLFGSDDEDEDDDTNHPGASSSSAAPTTTTTANTTSSTGPKADLKTHIETVKANNNLIFKLVDTAGGHISGTGTSSHSSPQNITDLVASEEKAWRKVEKYQEISKLSKAYAKKKDAQCSELAEKLREVITENTKLIEQISELQLAKNNQAARDATTKKEDLDARFANLYNRRTTQAVEQKPGAAASASRDAEIEKLRNTITTLEQKSTALTALLNERDHQLEQVSMYVEETTNHNPSSSTHAADATIHELKKQLRKARHELREMTLVKADSESQALQIQTMADEFEGYKKQNMQLEAEIKRLREDNTQLLSMKQRALHENRLKLQVERLEHDKLNLMAEMREKSSNDAQERRDLERKHRSETRELEAKAESARVAASRKDLEQQDLVRKVAEMERKLDRKTIELEEALRNLRAVKESPLASAEVVNEDEFSMQAKQRTTLMELRTAKEDAAELRVAVIKKNEEIDELKAQLQLQGGQTFPRAQARSRNTSPVRERREVSPVRLSPMKVRKSIYEGQKETDTSEVMDFTFKPFVSTNTVQPQDQSKPPTTTSTTTPPGSPSISHYQTPTQETTTPKRLTATDRFTSTKASAFTTYSPRASMVPLDYSPEKSTTSYNRRSSAPVQNHISKSRRISNIGPSSSSATPLLGGSSRRISGGGIGGMDPGRRAAAQARLAEKRKVRQSAGGAAGGGGEEGGKVV